MLRSRQSNAFRGEKQCFAPRKAMLGQKSLHFGHFGKSVLNVAFGEFQPLLNPTPPLWIS